MVKPKSKIKKQKMDKISLHLRVSPQTYDLLVEMSNRTGLTHSMLAENCIAGSLDVLKDFELVGLLQFSLAIRDLFDFSRKKLNLQKQES